jgi:hypothetical protein
MRFGIPVHLLRVLRAWRAARPSDALLVEHDAFMLDPGLGPALILTADGRVLIDGTCWDNTPIREATDGEASEAIVIGARKTGIAALLELLPPRPAGAKDCPRCLGARFAKPFVQGASAAQLEELPSFICSVCHGLGWEFDLGDTSEDRHER